MLIQSKDKALKAPANIAAVFHSDKNGNYWSITSIETTTGKRGAGIFDIAIGNTNKKTKPETM